MNFCTLQNQQQQGHRRSTFWLSSNAHAKKIALLREREHLTV